MSKFIINAIFASVLAGTIIGSPTESVACPMCKTATEDADTDNRANAYMTSILFMLTMPALIFTGIGATMYSMSKREEKLVEELEASLPSEASQAGRDSVGNLEQ